MNSKKQLNLLALLADEIPRERGGAIGASGFDFQKNWGVSKIIELAGRDEEFLLVFDYHEDTVLLNRIEEAEKVVFFQIKQKEAGNWTHGLLTKTSKTSNSILAKLLKMREKFPDGVAEFRFSTNAPFKVALGDKGEDSSSFDEVSFKDVKNDILKEIVKKLQKEMPDIKIDHVKDHLFYERSKLPLVSTDNACVGLLDKYLTTKYPSHSFRSTDFYQTLFSEVKKKTNNKYSSYSHEWIRENKCISSKDFDGFLKAANQIRPPKDVWAQIEEALNKMSESASMIYKFKIQWSTLYFDVVNGDDLLIEVGKELGRIFSEIAKSNPDLDLKNLIDGVFTKYKSTRIERVYDDESLKLLIIYEYCK